HREHEEVQPVLDRLVEGAQYPGTIPITAAPLEQRLRLLASVAPEETMEEIHHRPEVTALLDVHLEEIPQIVERGRRRSQPPLLLDTRGLGVALRDDETTQRVPMLARQHVPDGLADLIAEADPPIGDGIGQEDSPPVIRHLHVIK